MTKESLKNIKGISTWGGVVITFSGIVLSVSTGGSWQGASLSFGGLLLTCCGHWATDALAKHQAAERAADEQRFAELKSRVDPIEAERKEWQRQVEENYKRNEF